MHVTPRSTGLRAFLVTLLLALFAMPAAAQTAGKIEGRVTDQATGQPLAGAQVVVVGTTLGNLTNQDGYYFINNVPAGLHDIQSQYIGYQSVTVQDQRILQGQTMTVNFQLPTQAVALEAITVRGESNVLVPRDKTVSKAIVTGDVVQQLPVTDIAEVVALQPGVIQYGGQFVIRGGRPGEASVYIDGVLVRKFNAGNQQGNFELGTNAVEEVNVLLGGFGAEYGSAQSGVVNYITRSGQQDFSGALSFSTDEILPNDVRWGNSRLEASLGGPLGLKNTSFHLALTAEGFEDRSPRFSDLQALGFRDQDIFFRPVGETPFLDDDGNAIVNEASGDTAKFMQFERIDGLGNRRPYNNADQYTFSGSVNFNPFQNTKISLGAVKGRTQGLNFSNYLQFRPKAISAGIATTDLYRLTLDQILLQSAERQAAVRINLAYTNDDSRSGQRADTTSLEPEGPDFLGFRFDNYELLFEDVYTFERFQTRLDSVLRREAALPLTPLETLSCPDGQGGVRACNNRQDIRLFEQREGSANPFGLLEFANRGLGGFGRSAEETWSLDVDLDFQANRVHRFGAGVELYKKEVTNLSSGVTSTFFQNVYRVEPTIGAFWIKDRMDIGELVLDVGVRYDYFDTDAKYPELPGVVFPFDPANENEEAFCGEQIDENFCAPRFLEQEAISTISPRLGVAFPISDATNFRLSYGHFFQIPDFSDLFSNLSTDVRASNTNSRFGRPIDAMKAVQFEIGLSHLFNPYTVLDLTAYNKDKLADATYRIGLVDFPSALGGPQDARQLTNLDFGNSKGFDVRLTRRYAEYFTAILGYSFLNTKTTGSDPASFILSFGRFTDPITGAPLSPAQALQPADFDQTHRFTIATTANFGNDAMEGSAFNPLLRNTNISATLTAGSGLPFTRSQTPGTRGRGATGARFDELLNSSRLPWTNVVDARLTRGFELGDTKLAAFVQADNLLNTRNQTNVFGLTGDPFDPGDVENRSLQGIASTDVVIAKQQAGSARFSFEQQQKILRDFGLADDDDAVLTVDEQKAVRGLQYVQELGLSGNFGTPRRVRLGVEWVF